MQVDEGSGSQVKEHLDLSMTRRLFIRLQGNGPQYAFDYVPTMDDFEREYQLWRAGEEAKVSRHLLTALTQAKDDIEAHNLLTVLRQILSVTVSGGTPSTFIQHEGLISEYQAQATNEHAKNAFNVLRSLL